LKNSEAWRKVTRLTVCLFASRGDKLPSSEKGGLNFLYTSAVARWNEVEALLPTFHPIDCYPPTAAAIGRDIFLARRDPDRAAACLVRGVEWIQKIALPQVPEAYRDSFLNRNSVNRALLAAASRVR